MMMIEAGDCQSLLNNFKIRRWTKDAKIIVHKHNVVSSEHDDTGTESTFRNHEASNVDKDSHNHDHKDSIDTEQEDGANPIELPKSKLFDDDNNDDVVECKKGSNKSSTDGYTKFGSAQLDALLFRLGLYGYVDGSSTPPSTEITRCDALIPNLAYILWKRQDKLILHAILTSTSDAILPYISSSTTSKQAWDTLHKTFANKNRSRVIALNDQLSSLKRENQAVGTYLHAMKSLADELRMAGSAIDDYDLILHILKGVGAEYNDLTAAIHVRETPISFDELHATFSTHELLLRQQDAAISDISIPTTNFARRFPHQGSRNTCHYRNHSNQRSFNDNKRQIFPSSSFWPAHCLSTF
ncbi:hypothetical protein COLO4_12289 [Corchorus olitorius]|uniref:Uncharacterized protein n=1 Tax=Corchorus olitorius TaxID=93759 RepID=A0A1R3K1C8_9ROSI|nr:hypothetical protein COLO4_12289 [Corchorus olitorius]